MKYRVGKSPSSTNAHSVTTVGNLESLLSDWFGASVVLTSSGRAAIALAMQELGTSRYRQRAAVSRFSPICVMDAVSRHAFPMDASAATDADITLYYHQYGFRQLKRPPPNLIEDICHCFFISKAHDPAPWAPEIAVFSLPKFFPTTTMVGGIVAADNQRAKRLRDLRDTSPQRTPEETDHHSEVFRRLHEEGGTQLELVYLARLLNPQITNEELGGLPTKLSQIADAYDKRKYILNQIADSAGHARIPAGWAEMIFSHLPYCFPILDGIAEITRLRHALTEAGIAADIYQIDQNRNMSAPEYKPMLLVPYSHTISDSVVSDIIAILGSAR